MDWYEVHEFASDLRMLRGFLFDVVTSQEMLSVVGPGGMRKLDNFEKAMEVLSSLETKLHGCERVARFVDSDAASRIAKIAEGSTLNAQATEFRLMIEIEGAQRLPHRTAPFLRSVFNGISRSFGVPQFKNIFADAGEIPVRRMLNDIDRLIPYIENLEQSYYSRLNNDEETFKPSNVDTIQVAAYIDIAISQISNNPHIAAITKDRLNSYLSDAKAELATKAPAWKKIIGALVIVATILGGIADAPDALQNVNAAIKYVLGTSVIDESPRPDFGPALLPETTET